MKKDRKKDAPKDQTTSKNAKRPRPIADDALTDITGGAIYVGIWE